ncbi:MAG: hypothetical protein MHM6MM_006178 [Cercozoa sp. M6MM]
MCLGLISFLLVQFVTAEPANDHMNVDAIIRKESRHTQDLVHLVEAAEHDVDQVIRALAKEAAHLRSRVDKAMKKAMPEPTATSVDGDLQLVQRTCGGLIQLPDTDTCSFRLSDDSVVVLCLSLLNIDDIDLTGDTCIFEGATEDDTLAVEGTCVLSPAAGHCAVVNVNNNIVIPSGAVLCVDQGTTFDMRMPMLSDDIEDLGGLLARDGSTFLVLGSPDAPVVFTHTGGTQPGEWPGIVTDEGATLGLQYFRVEYAYIGLLARAGNNAFAGEGQPPTHHGALFCTLIGAGPPAVESLTDATGMSHFVARQVAAAFAIFVASFSFN